MFNGSQNVGYVDIVNTLKLYNQEELFQKYTGIYPDLNARYKSILRAGDSNPGCRFAWHSGLLYFVDNVGIGTKIYFNICDIVAHLHRVSLKQAIHLIINNNDTSGLSYNQIYNVSKKKVDIRFKWIPWEQNNYFGLDPQDLANEHVYRVSEYWIKTDDEWKYNSLHLPKETLTIAYYFPDTNHVKLYFPHKKDYKWYTNCTEEDVYGKYKIDYNWEKDNSLVIITKSQKDRLILEYDCNIAAIAPQSENQGLSKQIINRIKKFDKAFILYDPDETGQRYAGILSETTGIPWTNLSLSKDVFQLKLDFGVNFLKQYMSCLNMEI